MGQEAGQGQRLRGPSTARREKRESTENHQGMGTEARKLEFQKVWSGIIRCYEDAELEKDPEGQWQLGGSR